MNYIFKMPNELDLKNSEIKIKENIVEIENESKDITVMLKKDKVIIHEENTKLSDILCRVAKCTEKLREHFSLGNLFDTNDEISNLEKTVNELMNY